MDPSSNINDLVFKYVEIEKKIFGVKESIKNNYREINPAVLEITQISNEILELKNKITKLDGNFKENLKNVIISLDNLNNDLSETMKKIASFKKKVCVDHACLRKEYWNDSLENFNNVLKKKLLFKKNSVGDKDKDVVEDKDFKQEEFYDRELDRVWDSAYKLFSNDNNYLSISKESNERIINEIEKAIKKDYSDIPIISNLNIPKDELFQKKILKKNKDNSRQKQRLLLENLSKEERKHIDHQRRYISRDKNLLNRERGLIDRSSLEKMSRLEVIGQLIKEGKWMRLLRENKDNPKFSYQLIALYCEEKISLEELATAMTFDSAYLLSPSTCKIYELNEENLGLVKNVNITNEEKNTWIELIKSKDVPSNLKFFISNSHTAFDPYTKVLIEKNFSDINHSNIPGVFVLDDPERKFSIVSFGLAKAYYKKSSIKLVPILDASPDRLLMIERIKLHLSDYVLFLRGSNSLTRGSKNLFFAAMCSLSGVFDRGLRIRFQKPFVELAQKIEELLKSKTFRTKLNDEEGYPLLVFTQQPVKAEIVDYILDLVGKRLLVGNYNVLYDEKKGQNFMEQLEIEILNICEESLNVTCNKLKVKKFLIDLPLIKSIKEEVKVKMTKLISLLTPFSILVRM